MKKLTRLMKQFERRNNLTVSLTIHSDSSGHLEEFWDNEKICAFQDENELIDFLSNVRFKLGEDGKCISPIQHEV